jgi:hypothetical protein
MAEPDVSDILEWAISETWRDAHRSMPIWALQGPRYQHREKIWAQSRVNGTIDMPRDLAGEFLEHEAQSLEDKAYCRERAHGSGTRRRR